MGIKGYRQLFGFLFSSVSKDKERARRERILHLILVMCILLCAIGTIKAFSEYGLSVYNDTVNRPFPPTFNVILMGVFVTGFLLSRRGLSFLVSTFFVGLVYCVAVFTSYSYGADLPQSLLTYSLLIVMSGILIGSRFAIWLTVWIGVSLYFIASWQLDHPTTYNSLWKNQSADQIDFVMYGITLFAIAIISWLFNKESERALQRARQSELSLLKERNELEKKVAERTAELRQAQTEKINQLYRFAELGSRMSMLLHDLVNPVNVVSLNLEELQKQSKNLPSERRRELKEMKQLLEYALLGTRKIEEYIEVTRSSLRNTEIKKRFSIVQEIKMVIKMLQKRLNESQVNIKLTVNPVSLTHYANNTKFHQVMSNLICNAVDAYQQVGTTDLKIAEKIIKIDVSKQENQIKVKISDKAGGMDQKTKEAMFQQFFSTKSDAKHLGIGLSLCKEIIEHDFHGSIECRTVLGKGTVFTITLPTNSP